MQIRLRAVLVQGQGAIALLQAPPIHSMSARFGALDEQSLTRCLKDVL
ncbi:hypothetical protein [Thermoleptolyngbya sp.]